MRTGQEYVVRELYVCIVVCFVNEEGSKSKITLDTRHATRPCLR
jgi:hypothetical protein